MMATVSSTFPSLPHICFSSNFEMFSSFSGPRSPDEGLPGDVSNGGQTNPKNTTFGLKALVEPNVGRVSESIRWEMVDLSVSDRMFEQINQLICKFKKKKKQRVIRVANCRKIISATSTLAPAFFLGSLTRKSQWGLKNWELFL